MNYERNLTFILRVCGLCEDEIAEALNRIRVHEAATGTPAEAECGIAEEHAKQFPKKKRRPRRRPITAISTALAVAYVPLMVVLVLFFRVDIRDSRGPVTLLPATGLVLVGLLAGFVTDYFQPAQRSGAARAAVH